MQFGIYGPIARPITFEWHRICAYKTLVLVKLEVGSHGATVNPHMQRVVQP